MLFGVALVGLAAAARRRHVAWLRWHHHGYGDGYGYGYGREDGYGWGHRRGFGCGRSAFGPSAAGPGHHGHRAFWPAAAGGDDRPAGHPLGSRRGRWHLLRRLLRRVETTPTQERAIEEAVAEFTRSVKPVRAEAKQSRADLATAMRRTSLDEVVLGEMFARHDRLAEDLRKAFVGLLARVHEILDDIQRERFATLVEKGWLDPTDDWGEHL
jgi:hypothetical protein